MAALTVFAAVTAAAAVTSNLDAHDVHEMLRAVNPDAPSEMWEATGDNLHDLTAEGVVIVVFCAPWSGHCRRVAPELEKAAKALKGRARLIKVNGAREEALAKRFEVTQFPSLRAFVEGEPVRSLEIRPNAASIVDWVTHMHHNIFEVASARDVNEVKRYGHGMVIVGYGDMANDPGSKVAKIVRQLSYFSQNALATAATPEFLEGSGVAVDPPAIVVFRDAYDDVAVYKEDGVPEEQDVAKTTLPYVVYDDKGRPTAQPHPATQLAYDMTFADVRKFLYLASMPLLGHLTGESFKFFRNQCEVAGGLAMGWLFTSDDPEQAAASEALKAAAHALAKQHRHKIIMTYADADALETYKADVRVSGKLPAFFIDRRAEYYRFPEDKQDLTPDTLAAFVNRFTKGEVNPVVESQPALANPVVNGVTILTGNTFNDVVYDKSKGVFVAFIRGSHSSFDHVVRDTQRLARAFGSEHPLKDLVVATVDLDLNTVPPAMRHRPAPAFAFVELGTNEVHFWEPAPNAPEQRPRYGDLRHMVLHFHGAYRA